VLDSNPHRTQEMAIEGVVELGGIEPPSISS
jgi:hypothetical protein